MQSKLFGDALELATPTPALSTTRPPREKPKGEIAQAIPPGYARVTDGPLLDDDLVWSYSDKQFVRNDSPVWSDAKPADVDGLIYVVRSVRSAAGEGDRKYTIRR